MIITTNAERGINMKEKKGVNELSELVVDILKEYEVLTQSKMCEILQNDYNISICERQLREVYMHIRNKFANGEIDYSIISSKYGNYISSDFDEIRKDNINARKTALALLKYSYKRDQRIKKFNQLSFTDYLDLIEKE